jgi:hypothetical protein
MATASITSNEGELGSASTVLLLRATNHNLHTLSKPYLHLLGFYAVLGQWPKKGKNSAPDIREMMFVTS